MVTILITQERFIRGSPWPGPITAIFIIVKREVWIGRSTSSSFAVQPASPTINLQLHGSGLLLMRDMAPTLRLALASIGGMHTNLLIPSSLKIEKMILMLVPHRFLPIQTWTYHNWTLNSLQHEISTDDANCKKPIWVLSPRVKRILAQRAQYNEFVNSGSKN